MSAPSVSPAQRRDAEIPGTDQYATGQWVWVFRSEAWHPGIVISSSAQAAVVRYRPTPSCWTAVDTVMAHNLVHREDADPDVDQTAVEQTGPGGLVRRRVT
jgi:hypothetical protein